MKLAAVHRPTIAPSQSSAPSAPASTSLIGAASTLGDVGRQVGRGSSPRPAPLLGLAEQPRDRGGEDEEREERQQRQIGEVAGVDEAVVVDADRDPLDDDRAA